METKTIKKTMALDTLLYIPEKILEGLIGILTISIYTHYFITSDYGKYNLAILSANIAYLLALNWISQSVFRYITKYKGKKRLTLLYSTVFRGWVVICTAEILLSALTIGIYSLVTGADINFIMLLSITAIIFITYGTSQILFSLLSAIRSLKLFLSMSLFSVTFKLLTTMFLVNVFNLGLLSALISGAAIDIIVVLVIVLRLRIYKFIIPGRYSRVVLRKLAHFGIPLIINGIAMSLLNVSDRYVLGFLRGTSEVGIYTANYAVASAIFTMLNFAIMRGAYPSILTAWRKDDREQARELLGHAVRYYLMIALPAAIGLSTLSGPIANLFLDVEYRQGSFVITWVCFGMILLGLTEYSNKAWELTSRTRAISTNSAISGVFKIVSSIVLIRFYGYAAAAVTTLFAYLIYFCLSYFRGRKILTWYLPGKAYMRIFAANAIMGGCLTVVLYFLKPGKLELIGLVMAGGAIYGAVLYLSGEIKPEAHMLTSAVKGLLNRGKKVD